MTSYNVLIVDDSRITRRVIRRNLAIAEFPTATIHEAANGREAWDVLRRSPIDLLFLDLNMPVMDGLELAELIAQRPSGAPLAVVVVSANPDHLLSERLERLDVVEYVAKPFRPETFRAVLQRIMQRV